MSIERYFQRAMEAYEHKDLRKARKFFEKILKVNPEHLDAHYLLGTLFAQQGKRQKAFFHLNAAARLNPDSPMIQTNLGILHQQEGKNLQAEHCFRAAIDLDSRLFQAHFNLAIVLQQENRLPEAMDSLLSTLQIEPHFFPALVRIAQLLKATGNLSSAETYAAKAVQQGPDNVEALQLAANIYAQRGKIEQARKIYQRLVEVAPDDASAAYVLSVLSGELPQAPPRPHFQQIFNEISDTFDDHLEGLGYQGPARLLALFQESEMADRKFNRLLDIGCGTGTVGRLFRARTDYLMGIDIAEKMLECSRQAGLYDNLKAADIADLEQADSDFELVVAADVFPYLGDLHPVVEAIGARMTEGGYLLFTTERDQSATEYQIDHATGRYRFSDGYLDKVAERQGFRVVRMEIEQLRQEMGEWLEGHFCIWQKIEYKYA